MSAREDVRTIAVVRIHEFMGVSDRHGFSHRQRGFLSTGGGTLRRLGVRFPRHECTYKLHVVLSRRGPFRVVDDGDLFCITKLSGRRLVPFCYLSRRFVGKRVHVRVTDVTPPRGKR